MPVSLALETFYSHVQEMDRSLTKETVGRRRSFTYSRDPPSHRSAEPEDIDVFYVFPGTAKKVMGKLAQLEGFKPLDADQPNMRLADRSATYGLKLTLHLRNEKSEIFRSYPYRGPCTVMQVCHLEDSKIPFEFLSELKESYLKTGNNPLEALEKLPRFDPTSRYPADPDLELHQMREQQLRDLQRYASAAREASGITTLRALEMQKARKSEEVPTSFIIAPSHQLHLLDFISSTASFPISLPPSSMATSPTMDSPPEPPALDTREAVMQAMDIQREILTMNLTNGNEPPIALAALAELDRLGQRLQSLSQTHTRVQITGGRPLITENPDHLASRPQFPALDQSGGSYQEHRDNQDSPPFMATSPVLRRVMLEVLFPPECPYCFEQFPIEVQPCSAFIPPANVSQGVARCPQCSTLTCPRCKGLSHANECPKNALPESFIHAAEKNNWQKCRECGRYIERATGCAHMTCICGADFCYHCGARMGTCNCVISPNIPALPLLPPLDEAMLDDEDEGVGVLSLGAAVHPSTLSLRARTPGIEALNSIRDSQQTQAAENAEPGSTHQQIEEVEDAGSERNRSRGSGHLQEEKARNTELDQLD
ncbi:hypothetical protein B0T10DRAFT_574921 [Thelonectria olida]|uniref:RING-type domain-containing protein n=1 Tax=Thelonectria olida TaxID=1576542 RepID=A0A9P9AKV3_9HYPO|nr:hypothetical protein B0T10DRAFT_574921 [Thelonectria olida]